MTGTTECFTGLASTYAQHRPSYPLEAIAHIVDGLARPLRIADIGCGTGISTRLLARVAGPGTSVIGIDPNADMLEQARAWNDGPPRSDLGAPSKPVAPPAITYQSGTGERTGLDDRSVDLVVCAQAFHWFDALAALREFHRVLRVEGRLALTWNVRDPSEPFTAAYERVSDRAMADAATRGLIVRSEREADASLGGFFGNVRKRAFRNPQWLDLPGVLGRIRSASYFPKEGSLRDELERELAAAFERHIHNGKVILLHRTEVTLADRIG